MPVSSQHRQPPPGRRRRLFPRHPAPPHRSLGDHRRNRGKRGVGTRRVIQCRRGVRDDPGDGEQHPAPELARVHARPNSPSVMRLARGQSNTGRPALLESSTLFRRALTTSCPRSASGDAPRGRATNSRSGPIPTPLPARSYQVPALGDGVVHHPLPSRRRFPVCSDR